MALRLFRDAEVHATRVPSSRSRVTLLCNLPAMRRNACTALGSDSLSFQVFIALPNFDSNEARCLKLATHSSFKQRRATARHARPHLYHVGIKIALTIENKGDAMRFAVDRAGRLRRDSRGPDVGADCLPAGMQFSQVSKRRVVRWASDALFVTFC
jgi:hypothetical protein